MSRGRPSGGQVGSPSILMALRLGFLSARVLLVGGNRAHLLPTFILVLCRRLQRQVQAQPAEAGDQQPGLHVKDPVSDVF